MSVCFYTPFLLLKREFKKFSNRLRGDIVLDDTVRLALYYFIMSVFERSINDFKDILNLFGSDIVLFLMSVNFRCHCWVNFKCV